MDRIWIKFIILVFIVINAIIVNAMIHTDVLVQNDIKRYIIMFIFIFATLAFIYFHECMGQGKNITINTKVRHKSHNNIYTPQYKRLCFWISIWQCYETPGVLYGWTLKQFSTLDESKTFIEKLRVENHDRKIKSKAIYYED